RRGATPPQPAGRPRQGRTRLQRGLMTLGETARRRQGLGPSEQELDLFLDGCGLREESKGGGEPSRGALRRQACRRLAGLTEERNGGEISLVRRPLDVMRPCDRRHAPSCERLRAPLVADEP